jgi:hypothetical protein
MICTGPAAAALPLLTLLARRQPGVLVLDYLESLQLRVQVGPLA